MFAQRRRTNSQPVGCLWCQVRPWPRNAGALLDLLDDTAHRADFSETDRVRELVSPRVSTIPGVANNAHGLAMSRASQHLSPVSSLTYLTSGLESIQRLSELDRQLRDDSTVQSLCGEVEALLKSDAPAAFGPTIAEEEQLRLLNPAAQARFQCVCRGGAPVFSAGKYP